MNVTGIVVEYNPFHNGHLYHINKAKELTNPDVLVAVCSGNYNQRGDLSIINKFKKTEAALNNGVDLIVELPYIYTVQNANVFAKYAVDILSVLNVNKMVFGSETNNLEELKKYASLNIDITRLKQLMHDGNSFPKSYGLLAGQLYPNDLLAIAYLKALKNKNIEPLSIQRTNDYHGIDMGVIASATSIRHAIKQHRDISCATSLTIDEPVFIDDLYPYLRNLLFVQSVESLKDIFLVNEGIESLLKKNAIRYDNYEDFINASVSRRYTKSRIQRILLSIINQIKKEDVAKLSELNYIRVLGFNDKGRMLLKTLKNQINFVSQFKNIPEDYKAIEWKSSLIYSSLFIDSNAYIKRELQGPVIKK